MTKEKALDMLYEGDLYDAFGYVTADGYAALSALDGVVLQERKWIPATPLPMEADSYKHKRYWRCGVCGGHDFFNPQYGEKIKFCRYCGSELEVDDEGND